MKKRLLVTLLSIAMMTVLLCGCNKEEKNVTDESVPTIEEDESLVSNEEKNNNNETTFPEMYDSWKYGTTNGNANNYSLLEKRGNEVFFMNYRSNGKLCKIDLSNLEEGQLWSTLSAQILVDAPTNQINILNDKLYAVADYSDETKCRIVLMNLDGTDVKTIYEGYIDNMIVVNDWIYFINRNNDYIEKIDTNGDNHKILLKEACYYLNVYENKIIFQRDSVNESLHMMNVDGSNLEQYTELPCYDIVADNGYVYYVEKTSADAETANQVKRLKISDGSIEFLLEAPISNLNIYGDMVLCRHKKEGNPIACFYLSEKQILNGDFDEMVSPMVQKEVNCTNFSQICITEDSYTTIYFDVYTIDGEEVGSMAMIVGIENMDYVSTYEFQ